MKKVNQGELRKEYQRKDLGAGVRGKYFSEYQRGTNLVLLSPDVAKAFPDDQSVNEALRGLLKVAKQAAATTGTGVSGRRAKTQG